MLKNDEPKITRKYFAIDEAHKTASVKIMFKGGNRLYQPYIGISYMDYDADKGLTIHAGKRAINIEGRNLEILADHMSNQNVDWIAESKTKHDNHKTEIFISKITFYSE